ncbi:nucleotide diphosphatase Ecym_5418 [Eremothecium cymbalariae DBVPG|uniref:Maf-like protein n=1 Tax=Eremothecium cymbalariae (strain CBS 270.75 / DBVPG 7215 / KCTC 17166 / NRRL Y-17582) TaxID=931890 RepID=I6NDN0_ERECY|nr:hypothetical protein Ecym_5418 [Eremothecium cymbalariae DBVPG\
MSIIERIERDYEIILASSSPRRREIVTELLGFKNISIIKPSFEENLDKQLYKKDPIKYVVDTCKGKSDSIIQELLTSSKYNTIKKPILVICADTVVIDSENNIYEKPIIKEVQKLNLIKFRDDLQPLTAATAVNIICWAGKLDYSITPFHEVTKIHFEKSMPEELIQAYVDSEDGLQVAGGFKIQGLSATLISGIEGDYYNVVGLPASKTLIHLLRIAQPN